MSDRTLRGRTLSRRGSRLAALAAAGAAALVAAPAARAQQTPVPRAVPTAAAHALSLEEALAIAERQSEAVRIAQAGVERAQGQQTQARSGYLPQLTGQLSFQRTLQSQFQEIAKAAGGGGSDTTGGGDLANNPLARIFASENTVVAQVQGSQTLFAGGRVVAQNRAAAAGRRAAETGLTSARAQVKLDVAQAYYDAALADRLVVIAESSFVQSERAVRQTQLARNVGNTSEFELLRARVTRDNQRPAVIQARTQRQTAYLRLRQLLDLPLSEPLTLSDQLPDADPAPALIAAAQAQAEARPVSLQVDPVTVLADDRVVLDAVDSVVAHADTSAEARAPVRQAKQSVEAQRQALRAVRGQRLPAVQLSTGYQRFAYPVGIAPNAWSETFPNWTVALGLSVPLFTGGRIHGEEQVARANLTEAEQRLEEAKEYAALDASVAIAELTRAEAQYAASAGTAQVASRTFQIADVRYREGLSTQLELSETRVQLAQARANRAVAARNLQVARLRLALIRDLPLGGGGVAPGAQGANALPGAAAGALGGSQQQQPQTQGGAQPGAAGTSQPTGSAGGRN